ncbi:hypothetical protein [Halalkalibacter krulwichiae]|uniref:Uncharacterized protein n=1 Tax=Halalkalibacter krulwichiae TaxID=199441 RepID=A0A1X9M5R2_9BACI|nr:hypothetical protein [Halalkalibacter krulwichiae]ARK28776.1 hypothetical protein BkAM31D_02315 [Halalkalibacter krulwichiae]
MTEQQLTEYVKELQIIQKEIEYTDNSDLQSLILLLSKRLVLVGKISASLSGDYKRIYARRKQMHAEAYIRATKNKAAMAELAIVEIREKEAEAYEDMKRWNNAFDSTKEEINALKYKVKVGIADGSGQNF